MKYIERAHEPQLLKAFSTALITAILGPRRVGKSTLIDHYLQQHPEITAVRLNMDNMVERDQIQAGELETMIITAIKRRLEPKRRVWVTIDEAQKCPAIFEQIKVLYDRYKDQDAIKFIITGSALLELHRLSAESLAGRVNLYYLSAFNLAETFNLLTDIKIEQHFFDLVANIDTIDQGKWQEYFYDVAPYAKDLQQSLFMLLNWGGFPEVLKLSDETARLEYLGSYLQTYLERDVRAISAISDLGLYRHLLDVLAEQTGSLRDDGKIIQGLHCHRSTLQKYRGYLQATLLYEDIYPYIKSTLKRLVKSPKGYLLNNGLISFLQGVTDITVLTKTQQINQRLENWLFNELQVWLNKTPGRHQIHYWRTTTGSEVDFVVSKPPQVLPFEITYSRAIDQRKIRNLLRFREYEPKAQWGFYIYMGDFKFDAKNKIICLPAWAVT